LSSDLVTVGDGFWAIGVIEIGCITCSVGDIGVLVVDTTGDGLIVSVDSDKELITIFGDWSRWAFDGDCLAGVPFDGVAVDGIAFSIDIFERNRYHQRMEVSNV
jgi:hypothetical protein